MAISTQIKNYLDSQEGRELLADILIAAAAAAAAALLAADKGSKAMGKAAMQSAQTAALGVIAKTMGGSKERNGAGTGKRLAARAGS